MAEQELGTLRGTRFPPRPLSERSRRRRSLDERLRVRFPAPFRRLSAVLQRLSPRSRLRRAVLARGMARAYAAANRRDFDLIFTLNDPERYEYRPSVDLIPPDFETVYYGEEGYRRFWRLWLEAFDDIRWDPEEILDLGGKALVRTRQSAHGSGSGVAVSEPVYQLFTFRRGLVIRQEDFLDRQQALEACRASD